MTEKSRIIANAAPKAAPDATPRVSGETRGLPRHPCMSAPAVASAVPAIIAINTLGNLNLHIMSDCSSVELSMPKIILIVDVISRVSDDPVPIEITAKMRVTKQSELTMTS